jgi:hypothetical protein
MPMDPAMWLALEMGRERSTTAELPASLADRAARARLVHEIDPPIEWTTSVRMLSEYDFSRTVEIEGQRSMLMARVDPHRMEVAARLVPEVPGGDVLVSICLRLWAGCLDGAKVIAMETRSGPNTTDVRARAHANAIVPRAAVDPIYAAGAEAALAFKRLRNEPTSFDGVPADSILRDPHPGKAEGRLRARRAHRAQHQGFPVTRRAWHG